MMVKKVLVLFILFMFLMQGVACASTGQLVLEDVTYGAAIGGLLGIAWYLLDDTNPSGKLGTGIGLGIITGFVLGITDVTSMVELEDNRMTVGIPPITVKHSEYGTTYTTGIINIKF